MNVSKIPKNFSFDQNNKKRVTFLLATKNRPKFLEKALKNHRKVIKSDDELIVIEGDPESKSREIVKKFSDIVDIFICERDFSEGEALNKGVFLSQGKYIKLLTDDDIFYSEAIEKAYKIMEENPDIDVLLCGGEKIRGKEIAFAWVPKTVEYGKEVEDLFRWPGCGLGLVIRKKSLTKIGLFNFKALSTDGDFLAQAIASGANVKFCRLKMYKHFLQDHSVIIAQKERYDADMRRIKKLHGIKDDQILNLRIRFSQLFFPRLPQFIQSIYLETFKKNKKQKKIVPYWDGGLS